MPRIWAHRGLARRTIITSACLSLVIGAAFSFLALAISWLRGSAGRASHDQEVLAAASVLERGVIDIETGERGFVITRQPRFLQPWFAAMAGFHGQSMTLERLTAEGGPGQATAARRLVAATSSYIRGYSIPAVVTARVHPAAARTVAMTAEGKDRIDALRDEFTRFIGSERRIFIAQQDRTVAAAHRATIVASAGVAGSILLILFCGGYLVRSVVQPVRRASAMARSVAGGDLIARMAETGPAEVGVLGQSLNAMAASLAASRDDLRRIADDQAALRQVATLVARGVPPAEVFTAVAAETGRILAADCTAVARREPDGALRVAGSWARQDQAQLAPPPGSRWPAGAAKSRPGPGRTAAPAEMAGPLAGWARQRGMRSSVSAPITAEGHLWGVTIAFAGTRMPCPERAESRILGFAKLAAMAIANSDSRAQLIASRARVVSAADKARRQIERNLHDGTQQRLISLALELRTTQDRIPPGQDDVAERLSRTAQGLADVVDELRQISQGLHPVLLEQGGLVPALRALARRSGLPVELDLHLGRRLPEPAETAVYYVVAEALTNTAKHAGAASVRIGLGETAGTVRLLVRDDGPGGADPGRGSGLIGLTDRVEAIGGAITVTSPAGGGTTLAVTIPAGARAAAAAGRPTTAAW